MDPQLQTKSLIAFYFGATVATRKVDSCEVDSCEVVHAISQRAYRDVSRTLHGVAARPEADEIRTATHNAVVTFLTVLREVKTQADFDALHHTWCQETINRYGPATTESEGMFLRYGQAQKWLNMALKYCAVLDHPAITDTIYAVLHVPIDQIIYDNAATGLDLARPKTSDDPAPTAWSTLTNTQYRGYQRELRAALADHHPHTLPLDWEADVWARSPTEAQ